MKTVRDACQLQPNALSITLSDQIEQLDEFVTRPRARALLSLKRRTSPKVCRILSSRASPGWPEPPPKPFSTSNKQWAAAKLTCLSDSACLLSIRCYVKKYCAELPNAFAF